MPEPQRARLRAATTKRDKAEAEFREAVKAALDAGGSVRIVAELAGISPTTVQQWKNA